MWATVAFSLGVILIFGVVVDVFASQVHRENDSHWSSFAVPCLVHFVGSFVWPHRFRHRILHFKYMHPVREIVETQKLSAATGIIHGLTSGFMSTIIPVVSSCPGAPGYKLNNVLSGLKHLRTHECVGQPLVNVVDWTVMRALTPVKDRKQHDLCRACATTSSLEGDGFIVTGNMSPLSEQQPVNCDTVDSDCNGCPSSRRRD